MRNSNLTIVLDDIKYKDNEEVFDKISKKYFNQVEFFYTKYEDRFIRFVRKIKFFGGILRRISYWLKSLIYAIDIYFRDKHNNILCINPIVGYFICLLNVRKKKKVILMGFLFEPKSSKLYYRTRYMFTRFCISKASKIIVYSKVELEYYTKMFNYNNKFHFLKYGRDYSVDKKNEINITDKYIASGGGSNRDYETLLNSFRNLQNDTDEYLYIATLPECINNSSVSSKCKILNNIVVENFGNFLLQSRFVVIPLKENNISAGHMVVLQALQLNKVIIVTEIEGMKDYVTTEQVIFVKPNNVEDLTNKISYVSKNLDYLKNKFSNNKNYYYENYTFNKLFDRAVKFSKDSFYEVKEI